VQNFTQLTADCDNFFVNITEKLGLHRQVTVSTPGFFATGRQIVM